MNNALNQDDTDWDWTTSLSVGVNTVDDDHKRLFQLFHDAYLLSQKEPESTSLNSLLVDLIAYTQSHFKREEAIMSASNYPFCENHFALHEQLIKQLDQQFVNVETGHKTATEFVTFLRNWFVEHIKETDRHIASYVSESADNMQAALREQGELTIAQHCTIHLVDDDQDYVQLMQEMSGMVGLKSICYTSGRQFLQAPITNADLVVLDLNMPEKDGIEVMRELADMQISPTFILVSGFDKRVLHSAKQLAESRGLQVAEILCKPLDIDKFTNVLTKVHTECNLKFFLKQNAEIQIKTDTNVAISVDQLKQAFEKNELIVYFQPQVRFDNNQLVGAEVLIRWQHPKRGLVFPDQFIPLAEQNQLMEELTETVILQSIQAYKLFKQAGIQLTLSINLSAQNINELSFPEKLGGLLNNHNVPHEAFVLELTESEILTDTSAALDILNRLRMKGFLLSIDDFGTGDSSLKRLYQSPFSELKIDQHFVMRIEKDAGAMAIVRICTLLAKEFNMKTVAEGVETQEIWDKLKAIGCDLAQGYFISKPIPIEEFISFCKENKYEN